MKGIVLAGGTATRLFPLTIVTNKHLLPIYDRPMIYYPIETLAGMGIREVLVIVGGKSVGDVVELLGDGSHFGLDLTYRYQAGAYGIAQAIGLARDFVGAEAFCCVLGDNILRGPELADVATEFESSDFGAGALLYRVPDPERFGVAELDDDGHIVRLIEKPKDPPSNLALVGVYLFSSLIFDAARSLEPSWRGELEITEAIDKLIDDGRTVRSEVVRGWWKDTGQLADMLEANRLVLEELVTEIEGEVDEASKVEGRVVLGAGARLERSVVRGPAVIGAGAHIEDAFIGPYTSIGDDVHVRRSEVENSIVLSGSVVEDLGTRMEASLLGKEVKLTRSEGMPKTLRLLVGDKSEIKLI